MDLHELGRLVGGVARRRGGIRRRVAPGSSVEGVREEGREEEGREEGVLEEGGREEDGQEEGRGAVGCGPGRATKRTRPGGPDLDAGRSLAEPPLAWEEGSLEQFRHSVSRALLAAAEEGKGGEWEAQAARVAAAVEARVARMLECEFGEGV